ncbi:helix-turn-helix domain-containing protein [Tepidimicrobium xylanilyticum]|uniref:DNA-binding transcriptional regulator, XRE-family HTH domain n=1 Tax=Tepidimicrobium xylanilyticum TaxID=1123352 RepID=A0A1H2SFT2_9FIRM|nr:helix-turn-helix domain-containing protein [Tepidimicrobium xylanilyticum]GMG96222.1 hypothetical protein EN5CB1_10480 [Tepidimicrobium xylanilyticum]SDW30491.1 DNA-binding transcriptional regulator, XRE-family HTH domain [Tepidimicrobium xylanilyticum]
MSSLAKRIKELRQERNLTQEEFGNIFGIVKSTVSLYESGKSTPDDELKKKIAKYFNVSLDYLMGVSDVRNPYKETSENKIIKDDGYELTPEEKELLETITSDPELSVLFHDLKSAPKKKIKQLLKTWEFINEQFEEMEKELDDEE